jgi:hypothetical protein
MDHPLIDTHTHCAGMPASSIASQRSVGPTVFGSPKAGGYLEPSALHSFEQAGDARLHHPLESVAPPKAVATKNETSKYNGLPVVSLLKSLSKLRYLNKFQPSDPNFNPQTTMHVHRTTFLCTTASTGEPWGTIPTFQPT